MTTLDKKVEKYLSDEFNEGIISTVAKVASRPVTTTVGKLAGAGAAVATTTALLKSRSDINKLKERKAAARTPQSKETIQRQIDALSGKVERQKVAKQATRT